nr:insulinase family protein [Rhizobium ruizarguesonis]
MSHKMECSAAWRFLATVALASFASSAFADTSSTSWPQTQSEIKADTDVHFGTLANGMRFAIMRNVTPPGQAAIRFRIGSGSLDENDSQQGLAHVLEHMAFKGSTHVAEGEMIRILQRKGLAFGPDTNAHTSYDETVYALDLPEVDADTISTSLMLMRETASELTLDAGAFDRERGVILSEERLRDMPQYRASLGIMNSLLAGQRATMRAPIGKADIISNAPVDLVRDYYRANYRPDRATLIVVGDIDPAAMEVEIRQRFSDWKAVGPAQTKADLGALVTKGETAEVIVIPGDITSIQIAWTRPYDAAPDTLAKRRAGLIEDLGFLVLNRRVSAIASKADAPFINADVRTQEDHDLFRQAANEAGALSSAALVSAQAPIWSSDAPYGSFSRDGYSWNNDVWGPRAGPQTISVSGVNRWSVWSDQPNTPGIKSYPHVAFNIGKPLSSINTLSSSFNQEVPTGGAWDVAYDIWDSSNKHEIMLWTNYTGNSDGSGNVKPISYHYAPSGAAIPVYSNVNVGGATWNVFEGEGPDGHKVISLLRTSKTNSGTVDIKSILQWIKSKGYFGDIKVGSVQYGVEITSSPGGKNFNFNNWSVTSK